MEGQQNEALEQRQNCCCLTGHRSLPSDPDRLAELRQNLRRLICDLAQQGITTFYTGGALGFDTMAAMMVLELKADCHSCGCTLRCPTRSRQSAGAAPIGCCTSKLRNTPTGCIWSTWNILLSV